MAVWVLDSWRCKIDSPIQHSPKSQSITASTLMPKSIPERSRQLRIDKVPAIKQPVCHCCSRAELKKRKQVHRDKSFEEVKGWREIGLLKLWKNLNMFVLQGKRIETKIPERVIDPLRERRGCRARGERVCWEAGRKGILVIFCKAVSIFSLK